MRFLIVVAVVVATVGALPTGWVLPGGNIGYSGILRPDGTYELFSHEFVQDIASIGPTGIVTKSGKNIQFDENLRRVKRSSVGFVSPRGNIGLSGIVRIDGTTEGFTGDFTHNIVLIGPSGIVTADGKNLQLTQDLHRA